MLTVCMLYSHHEVRNGRNHISTLVCLFDFVLQELIIGFVFSLVSVVASPSPTVPLEQLSSQYMVKPMMCCIVSAYFLEKPLFGQTL